MAQTEVKPISQDELSQILGGNVDSILTPENKEEVKKEEKKEEPVKQQGFKKRIDTEFSWTDFDKEEEPEESEEKKDEIESTNVTHTEAEKKSPGRKTSDLVSMVNELVEAKDLFGFEDGPVKNIDEAKELIKLNIEQSKKTNDDDIWQDKIKTYSPQIQAILHYAEQGGQDVTPLISAIAEVEKVGNLDIESEDGQENIISEYLKSTGWSEEDIKEELEIAKDLGKLKTKAEKFLPKLDQMKQQRIAAMMQDAEVRQKQAEEARRSYLSTIKDTLDKEKLGELKLVRQEKALIWDGLTDIKYTSWSGQPTNLFFKKLEEMQAGDKADYDHFLEIVYHTLNRKAFKDKLKEETKNSEVASTVRQLKIEQSRKSATNEGFEEEEPRKSNSIKRQAFRNPWG